MFLLLLDYFTIKVHIPYFLQYYYIASLIVTLIQFYESIKSLEFLVFWLQIFFEYLDFFFKLGNNKVFFSYIVLSTTYL